MFGSWQENASTADVSKADHVLQSQAPPTACPAIWQLFPEVLAHIFSYCVPHLGPVSITNNGASWLSFSQVCRRWRCIALGERRLWSCPVMRNTTLALEMVHRAGRCPLSLDIDLCTREPSKHAKQLTTSQVVLCMKLDTVRFLSIKALQRLGDLRRLLDFPPGPAPILEELVLDTSACPTYLPTGLPFTTTPRLRALQLRGLLLPSDSGLFDNLTQLVIDNAPCYKRTNPARQPVTSLLQILCRAPQLVSLQLNRALCFDDAADLHLGSVRLPQLRTLSLVESVPAVCLLRHLELPQLTQLTIQPVTPTSSEAILALYSWLQQFFTDSPQREIRAMSVWTSPYVFITDFSFTSSPHLLESPAPISIAVSCKSTSDEAKEALLTAVARLPLDQVQSLHVRDAGCFLQSAEAWNCFAALPNLQNIRVEHAGLHAFAESMLVETTLTNRKIPYPVLRSLDVVLTYSFPAHEGSTLLDALIRSFQTRLHAGVPLVRLTLHTSRWTFCEDPLIALGRLVQQVALQNIRSPSVRLHPSDYPVPSYDTMVSNRRPCCRSLCILTYGLPLLLQRHI